jgi:hypothetical protein
MDRAGRGDACDPRTWTAPGGGVVIHGVLILRYFEPILSLGIYRSVCGMIHGVLILSLGVDFEPRNVQECVRNPRRCWFRVLYYIIDRAGGVDFEPRY